MNQITLSYSFHDCERAQCSQMCFFVEHVTMTGFAHLGKLSTIVLNTASWNTLTRMYRYVVHEQLLVLSIT